MNVIPNVPYLPWYNAKGFVKLKAMDLSDLTWSCTWRTSVPTLKMAETNKKTDILSANDPTGNTSVFYLNIEIFIILIDQMTINDS